MNEELKGFKYLFDDSRLPFINERGVFFKRPTTAQEKDWHRKMVTLYSGDEEEIDMMDELLLNPKYANPYLSMMYIKVLVNKVINSYGENSENFRKRAYKSMIENAKVCGELGKVSMVHSLEKDFNHNQDMYNMSCYNPFVREDDAIKTKKEVLDTITINLYLREKYKKEIEHNIMARKLSKLYLANKDVLNEQDITKNYEK